LTQGTERYRWTVRFIFGFAIPFSLVVGDLLGIAVNPRCSGAPDQLIYVPVALAVYSVIWGPVASASGLISLAVTFRLQRSVWATRVAWGLLIAMLISSTIVGFYSTPPCMFTP